MSSLTNNTLTAASRQWATRPSDERFTSLTDMLAHFTAQRRSSAAKVVPSRAITVAPAGDAAGLVVAGPNGNGFAPSHWSFGQLANLAGAPAGYLRSLPSPLVADALNYGLQVQRDVEDVGLLLHRDASTGVQTVRAATGPRYGRIWNADVIRGLTDVVGDGVSGDWRVPGIFGKALTEVTKENTTLFAGDRDFFVFLADEQHRIEIPNRRDGQPGSLARGFFVQNSEVGSGVFGISTFLFDYVCQNRIVWGASEAKELRIRHTSGAPERFLREVAPALQTYANSSASSLVAKIEKARDAKLDNVNEWLAKRFGPRSVAPLQAIHQLEEGRPIESLWDVSTAVTARARSIEWQDDRVAMEREAGAVLDLAA